MKLARLLLPVFLIGLLINGPAETNAATLDPAQDLFFSQFRTAIHGEDARQLMGLTHPQSLQCIDDDNREEYYGQTMKVLVQALGRQQTIKEIISKEVGVQDIQNISDTAAQSGMKWPTPPEVQLIIKYEIEGAAESTATIYISRDQGQWKWVHACFQ